MLRRIVTDVLRALVAALAAGVLMGAAARVLMRLVAVASGEAGEFSLVGSAFIVVVFVLAVLPGALLASLYRGRGRSLLLVAGTGLLLFVAVGTLRSDLGDVTGLSAARWTLVGLAAAGVLVAILVLPVLTLRLLGRSAARRSPSTAPAEVEPVDELRGDPA